jgi:hypothetical protein
MLRPAVPDQQRRSIVNRFALLERLKEIQQMPRYQGRDISTISAVLSNQALARHVELCEEVAGVTPRLAAQGG